MRDSYRDEKLPYNKGWKTKTLQKRNLKVTLKNLSQSVFNMFFNKNNFTRKMHKMHVIRSGFTGY